MGDNSPNRKQFTLEMTEEREKLMSELEDELLPRIGKSSTSAVVEESFRLALAYIEKSKKVEKELESEIQNWSLENFKLEIDR